MERLVYFLQNQGELTALHTSTQRLSWGGSDMGRKMFKFKFYKNFLLWFAFQLLQHEPNSANFIHHFVIEVFNASVCLATDGCFNVAIKSVAWVLLKCFLCDERALIICILSPVSNYTHFCVHVRKQTLSSTLLTKLFSTLMTKQVTLSWIIHMFKH